MIENSNSLHPDSPFPTFRSPAEAEAYSERTGDAYFEICYHLEGRLNLCAQKLHDLYAGVVKGTRPRMQTGVVRDFVCPDGWPKHPRTLISILLSLQRYSHEKTCHAHTIARAIRALEFENQLDTAHQDPVFNTATSEPRTAADTHLARNTLLRLCDWIESNLHFLTHRSWYHCPDSFEADPETSHLANIGFIQRHLANLSERDRRRWAEIHERSATQHQSNIKVWSTVGRVQHDPRPRTWTHPDVDERVIRLWPLMARHNWTYTDLLKVLDALLPPCGHEDRRYPLDSEGNLKMHCRSICGLAKNQKGKTAEKMPEGFSVAQLLFSATGK
jgi:hypothetical protein